MITYSVEATTIPEEPFKTQNVITSEGSHQRTLKTVGKGNYEHKTKEHFPNMTDEEIIIELNKRTVDVWKKWKYSTIQIAKLRQKYNVVTKNYKGITGRFADKTHEEMVEILTQNDVHELSAKYQMCTNVFYKYAKQHGVKMKKSPKQVAKRKTESLCYDCQNYYKCPKVMLGTPIQNWQATETEQGYHVTYCPLFLMDEVR